VGVTGVVPLSQHRSFSESAATFSSQLACPLHLEKDSLFLPGQAVRVVFSTHSLAKADTERQGKMGERPSDEHDRSSEWTAQVLVTFVQ